MCNCVGFLFLFFKAFDHTLNTSYFPLKHATLMFEVRIRTGITWII